MKIGYIDFNRGMIHVRAGKGQKDRYVPLSKLIVSGGQPVIKREKSAKKNWKQICKEKLNFDPDLCPCCKKGKMITKELLEIHKRGPPEITAWSNLQIAI